MRSKRPWLFMADTARMMVVRMRKVLATLLSFRGVATCASVLKLVWATLSPLSPVTSTGSFSQTWKLFYS